MKAGIMKKSTVSEVYKRLRVFIRNKNWKEGDRLPTLRDLALHFRVSHVSVMHAIRRLESEGIIYTIRGSGMYIGCNQTKKGPVTEKESVKWKCIQDQLMRSIVGGEFTDRKELPPMKILQHRYDANYRTIKKALHSLEQEQVIQRYGRGYRILTRKGIQKKDTIYFITIYPLSSIGAANFTALALSEFVRTLEGECIRRNLQLRMVAAQDTGILHRIRHDITNLGILLYFPREQGASILSYIHECRAPIAIIDDYEYLKMEQLRILQKRKQLFMFGIDEEYAGRRVGRFLIECGHRGIAFISPFHNERFSRLRYEGIVSSVKGFEGLSVVPFTIEESKIAYHGKLLSMMKSFEKHWSVFSSNEKHTDSVPVVLDEYLDPERYSWIFNENFWYMQFESAYRKLLQKMCTPLFEQAFADKMITAWVGANDSISLVAKQFLDTKMGNTKRPIALIGYDNTAEAMYRNLSSFEFSLSSIARQAIDAVLYPRRFVRYNGTEYFVKGYVVGRDST